MVFAKLYNPIFDGLVSVGGGDAGDHVYYTELYGNSEHDVYNGMVGFHAVAFWIMKASGWNAFEAFRFIFYLTAFLLLMLIGLIIPSVIEKNSKYAALAPFIFFFFSLYPANKLILPLFHYLQADGYYPQLFGLLPLFLCWYLFTLTRNFIERGLLLAATIIVYRYTYGLNLGDLALASTLLIALDRNIPLNSRTLRLGIALIGTLASLEIYSHFIQLTSKGGMTVDFDYVRVIIGSAILAISLLKAVEFAPNPREATAYSFAGAFGFVVVTAQIAYLISPLPLGYYFYKYNFHATFLLSTAALLFATMFAVRAFDNRSYALRPVGVLVAVVIGFVFLIDGYKIYRTSYKERVHARASFDVIKPLADTEALVRIREVLDDEKKKFGGFITTPDWQLAAFMNAALGFYPWQKLPFYREPNLRLRKGVCVFWYSSTADLERIGQIENRKAIQLIKKLEEEPQKKNYTYSVKWSDQPKQLSQACY